MMSDGIFYGAAAVIVIGLVATYIHMDRTIDAQRTEITSLKKEVETARESLARLTAWQAETEGLMHDHAQTVRKQEAEFRSLRAKVKDAYKDKDTAEWGNMPVPPSMRVLLKGDGK